jgi:hypothetical protein
MSGEKERAVRLARLVEVQSRKRQMEEWRLGALKREAVQLAETSAEILESLGEQSLLNGLFLEGRASALRRNEGLIVQNRGAQESAEAGLNAARGIEKRLERAAGDAAEVAARIREQEDLLSALDDFLTTRSASFE